VPTAKVRRSILAIGVVLALQLLHATGAVAQGAGADWPQYLHDASGSGFTTETLLNPSNAGSLKAKAGWPVSLTNGAVCPSPQDYCSALVASQPTIATVAGTTLLFVGAWNGSEYAICPSSCGLGGTTYSSGQVVWSTYVGRTSGCGGPTNSRINGVTGAAAVGTAMINGVSTSVVYVGAGGDIALSGAVIPGATSQLFALDPLTGAVVWDTPLAPAPSHYLWSSPVLANGSLYIGIASADDCPLVQGGVMQIDPNTGHVLHTFNTVPSGCTGASVWGSAAVDRSGAIYVATGNDGTCSTSEPHAESVLKLSSSLGLLAGWRVPTKQRVLDGDFGDTPTLFAGTVTPAGMLRSLLGVANKNGYYYVFDTAKVGNGPLKKIRVAVGGSDPETGGGSVSPSSWDGHQIYVAGGNTTISGVSYPGSVRAFDPNSLGTPVWQHGLSGGPVLAAVTSNPGLAVASSGAFVTVVNTSNGTTVFTGVASGFYGAPSIAYGVLYEGDTSGLLHAYSVNGQ
jgi:PQQ-like domain